MSQRLQVLLDNREWAEIRRTAKLRQMTIADWVRQELRNAISQQPLHSSEHKLNAIRKAAGHSFPTPDIDSDI